MNKPGRPGQAARRAVAGTQPAAWFDEEGKPNRGNFRVGQPSRCSGRAYGTTPIAGAIANGTSQGNQ